MLVQTVLLAQSAASPNGTPVKTSVPYSSLPITQEAPKPGGGIFAFEEETHDFGTLEQDGDASFVFKFINTGTEEIVITGAKGSCGCTVPTWPDKPIAPGASGEISVKYDSHRIGIIEKNVTISSNASIPQKMIYIKGNIVAKPEGPSFTAPIQGAPASMGGQ